jgi:hypothetical protein
MKGTSCHLILSGNQSRGSHMSSKSPSSLDTASSSLDTASGNDCPDVCFEDITPEHSVEVVPDSGGQEGETSLGSLQAFEAAAETCVTFNDKMIEIAQRNINANFSILRRLAGARSFSEILGLQTAFVGSQCRALMGQADELLALWTKLGSGFVPTSRRSLELLAENPEEEKPPTKVGCA